MLLSLSLYVPIYILEKSEVISSVDFQPLCIFDQLHKYTQGKLPHFFDDPDFWDE